VHPAHAGAALDHRKVFAGRSSKGDMGKSTPASREEYASPKYAWQSIKKRKSRHRDLLKLNP